MRSFYKYLLFLFCGAGFAACVDDKLIDSPLYPWQEGDTPFIVNLRLKTNSSFSTRVNEDGEGDGQDSSGEQESKDPVFESDTEIGENGNIALFFTEDGKYISWSELYSVNPVDPTSKDMDATYTCRFYGFAEEPPRQVLVVVNASDKILKQLTTKFAGWTLDEVYKQIWEEKGELDSEQYLFHNKTVYKEDPYENLGFRNEDGKLYFTMTNTSYFEEKDGNYVLHCAEPILPTSVTSNANSIQDLSPVTVYLERMVSKFSFTSNVNPNQYIPVGAGSVDVVKYSGDKEYSIIESKWGIQFLGWGMNGLETQNYIFKNLTTDLEGVEDWIYKHEAWNSINRSFWSIDPHYIKDESETVVYPWQFDDAKDQYDADPTKRAWYDHFQSYDRSYSDTNPKVFALTYYPFTHFCPDFDAEKETTGYFESGYEYQFSKTPVYYTPENTFDPLMVIDRSRGTRAYELAGTHIILCARILTLDGDIYKNTLGNLYRNRVGVGYTDEVDMFMDFKNAINMKLESQRYLYYKYYPWDESEKGLSNVKKSNYGPDEEDLVKNLYGQTFRAEVNDLCSLYYYDEDKSQIRELNYNEIQRLDNSDDFKLYRDADAVNADGKVIPWVMKKGSDGNFKALSLFILKEIDLIKDAQYAKRYNPDSRFKGEGPIVIAGYNDNADNNDPVRSFVSNKKIKFEKYDASLQKDNKWTDFDTGERDNNDIQSLFFEIWGVADCFHHGFMYYPIGVYAPYNGKPTVCDKNWPRESNPEFSDKNTYENLYWYYGVVRNNYYKFTLNSISDLGIPVANPFKPIVPNYKNKKDQTKFEMEILQWHIEDQSVFVP